MVQCNTLYPQIPHMFIWGETFEDENTLRLLDPVNMLGTKVRAEMSNQAVEVPVVILNYILQKSLGTLLQNQIISSRTP